MLHLLPPGIEMEPTMGYNAGVDLHQAPCGSPHMCVAPKGRCKPSTVHEINSQDCHLISIGQEAWLVTDPWLRSDF